MKEGWSTLSTDVRTLIKIAFVALVPVIGFGIRTHIVLTDLKQGQESLERAVERSNDNLLIIIDDNTTAINNNAVAIEKLIVWLERDSQIDTQALVDPTLQLDTRRRSSIRMSHAKP